MIFMTDIFGEGILIMMNEITEIGVIHTAHKSLINMPIQPKFAEEQMGTKSTTNPG